MATIARRKKSEQTRSKWLQAASTAVADHDFPIEFDTIILEAHLGSNPTDAILKLSKAERIEDLKSTNSAIRAFTNNWYIDKSQSWKSIIY